jgi:predicted MFS family arabinose efflux permease
VLRVRTNVVIIIASVLAYFYFAGLQSFVMIFITDHYRIAQSVASVLTLVVGIGAVAGVYLGGRTADRLLGRGRLNAQDRGACGDAVALPLLTIGARGCLAQPTRRWMQPG